MNNPLEKQKKGTSKDFFLWLGVMVTLYLSTISLVVLLFEYIKILFPDPLTNFVDPFGGSIRFAIASLVVAFPLYVYLTRVINTDMRKHKEKRELTARKWIISLTLFIAALTLIIDLITLINVFLGGEITSQFILKVIVILVVIGGVFLYYFYDLKGYWQNNESKSKLYGGIVSAIILISIISGFLIMGSPATQRLLRFDQEKVFDLQNTQGQIISYWQNKGELPEELSELENSLSYFLTPTDSQTGESYVYEKTGDLTFNLCATFNKEFLPIRNEVLISPKFGVEQANWEHASGDVCFERTIDPELYSVGAGRDIPPLRVPTLR